MHLYPGPSVSRQSPLRNKTKYERTEYEVWGDKEKEEIMEGIVGEERGVNMIILYGKNIGRDSSQ